LEKLLNLRGKRKKQIIERASEELVNIDFLETYKIEPGKRVKGLVYKAVKQRPVRAGVVYKELKQEPATIGKAKGSRKHLKGQ